MADNAYIDSTFEAYNVTEDGLWDKASVGVDPPSMRTRSASKLSRRGPAWRLTTSDLSPPLLLASLTRARIYPLPCCFYSKLSLKRTLRAAVRFPRASGWLFLIRWLQLGFRFSSPRTSRGTLFAISSSLVVLCRARHMVLTARADMFAFLAKAALSFTETRSVRCTAAASNKPCDTDFNNNS